MKELMEKGKIIKIISNQYDVRLESGETLRCVAMGKLRKRSSPIVGDYVQVCLLYTSPSPRD